MRIFWTQGERPLKQIESHKRIKKKFQQQNKDYNKKKIYHIEVEKIKYHFLRQKAKEICKSEILFKKSCLQ